MMKFTHMRIFAPILSALCTCTPTAEAFQDSQTTAPADHLVIVQGASGTDQFESEHAKWKDRWLSVANANRWQTTVLSTDEDQQKGLLREALSENAAESSSRLWLVMIGHGTASPAATKFNLVGEDVSAKELSAWLNKVRRPVAVIGCFSASGGFLAKLSSKGRVVVSATRSANELNYSRFGEHIANSISDAASDLDHDREVSLLEAFLAASTNTQQFYLDNGRLASEHAILDDNGDKTGTSSDFFVGVRVVGRAKSKKTPDGKNAAKLILSSLPGAIQLSTEQEATRARLEAEVDALRSLKGQLPAQNYYDQLEVIMLQIAQLYTTAAVQKQR